MKRIFLFIEGKNENENHSVALKPSKEKIYLWNIGTNGFLLMFTHMFNVNNSTLLSYSDLQECFPPQIHQRHKVKL